jgi:rare lipoprotein A
VTRLAVLVLALAASAACSRGAVQEGVHHTQEATQPILQRVEGLASYYAKMLDGRPTASGLALDLSKMVAAHPEYPFGTLVRVTNLKNQEAVEVEVIDRGPAAGPRQEGVIIDLSRAAAEKLRLIEDGRAKVLLEVLRWGNEGEHTVRTD